MTDHNYTGKRILVTGAAGFIGSHLAEALVRANASVKAMVHYNALGSRGHLDRSDLADQMEIVAGDIRDRDSVRDAVRGCDLVFHLAALVSIPDSYNRPWAYYETIEGGTLNILAACRGHSVPRLVHTSTSEVYGSARYVPMDEAHPIHPQSPYADAKASADNKVESWHHSYGIPAVTVRPFNTFGERQSARAIVPTIIGQYLAGNRLELGNLYPVRDLNYVANTVDGFLAAGLVPGIEGCVVNIGSGEGVSIGELANIIAGMMGRDESIWLGQERTRPRSSEVDRLVCDASLARAVLGWEPRVSLEAGLMRTIEWMRAQGTGQRAAVYAV